MGRPTRGRGVARASGGTLARVGQMQNIYLTEIHGDDEPDLEHDGEEVEQLQPIEVPLETLTAKQVAAAKKAAAPVPAGGREEQAAERARQHGNTAFGAGRFDVARKAADALAFLLFLMTRWLGGSWRLRRELCKAGEG